MRDRRKVDIAHHLTGRGTEISVGWPVSLTKWENCVIILSVGMPRAGSGWHYNLIHDLMVAAGHQDARAIRRQYHLERFLTEVNCNIGALTAKRLLPVLLPSLLGNTFAIKAHASPTPTALRLMRLNLMRTTYIYRDPRDAMLSAYEHGERSRASGHQNAFARLETFDDALAFIQQYLDVWDAWISQPGVLCCRYEDLLQDYDHQMRQLLEFLPVDSDGPQVQAVIEQYRPEQTRHTDQPGMHFRKGKIGRFREKFSPEQREVLDRTFEPFLAQMGYPL